MTERLYYTDAHLAAFDAAVVAAEAAGGRTLVTLDRTAFYPTSGGQPFDMGTLSGLPVVDVFENEQGEIVHAVEGAGLEPGTSVHGVVDWARRFDHMQQHTGQHVLSAAFEARHGARTVSVHFGVETATVDLDRVLTPEQIAEAEDDANRIVWDDMPVTVRFVTADEAARLPLRKESAREGTLRLVEIDGVDLSACGGTHVPRTGGVGVIGITSWERFKGGLRVEFVCGGRALRRMRLLRDAVSGSLRLLSVLPQDLPAGIARLQAESKDDRRALAMTQVELARYRAEEFVAAAETVAGVRLVARAVDGDATVLKTLASSVIARPGHLVVLVSTSNPAAVVVARSEDVGLRANDVLARLIAAFGGRGGGKPDLAQGGGLTGAPDQVFAIVRALLSDAADDRA